MSKGKELQKAIKMLMDGDRDSASSKLWTLEPKISDKKMRIKLIDALISASDTVEGGEKLLKLNREGTKIAKQINDPLVEAHFRLKRVPLLLVKLIMPQYEQANIKLSPNWFGFSTEKDKSRYEELENIIKKIESEIDRQFLQTIVIAKKDNHTSTLANAFFARGDMTSSRLLYRKSEYIREGKMIKLWLNFNIFRYPLFNPIMIKGRKNRKSIKNMTKNFTQDMLKAAELFKTLKNSNAGYAYHNLANNLRTHYYFKAATKYLKKSKKIALEHSDNLLLRQVKNLELEIKKKNQDIPNYLAGEHR